MIAAVALAAIAFAGCDAAAAPSSATFGAATDGAASPGTSALPRGASAQAATSAPTRAEPIQIDASLLAILPQSVDGQPLDESPEVEAADAEDQTLVGVARLAAAFVHDDNAANWAVVTVAAASPGTLTDAYFRSWRDSFDAGACEPAGGVTGSASAEMGGRDVTIGRCAGGVNTYHVRLPADRIVSITAFGDKRYGELIMNALTP